jgi:hypothetical protein
MWVRESTCTGFLSPEKKMLVHGFSAVVCCWEAAHRIQQHTIGISSLHRISGRFSYPGRVSMAPSEKHLSGTPK